MAHLGRRDGEGCFYRLLELDLDEIEDTQRFPLDYEPTWIISVLESGLRTPPVVVVETDRGNGYGLIDGLNRVYAHWQLDHHRIRAYELLDGILAAEPPEEPSDAALDAMERRAALATEGPWRSWVEGRDHVSGDSFIQTDGPDIYISYDESPNERRRAADLDFIAAAREDVSWLIAEIRRLRALLRVREG